MGAHTGADHFRAEFIRAARHQQHRAGIGCGSCAEQGPEVAGVLDAVGKDDKIRFLGERQAVHAHHRQNSLRGIGSGDGFHQPRVDLFHRRSRIGKAFDQGFRPGRQRGGPEQILAVAGESQRFFHQADPFGDIEPGGFPLLPFGDQLANLTDLLILRGCDHCGPFRPNCFSSISMLRWIMVGRPWGQVRGERHCSRSRSSARCSSVVRVCPPLTAMRLQT